VVETNCGTPNDITTFVLDLLAPAEIIPGKDGPVARFHNRVANVRPGVYQVNLDCQDGPNHTSTGKVTALFTVLPKAQVPTRPVGAPQTGGGFTATDLVG